MIVTCRQSVRPKTPHSCMWNGNFLPLNPSKSLTHKCRLLVTPKHEASVVCEIARAAQLATWYFIRSKGSQVSRSLVDLNCAIWKRHEILSWDTSPMIMQHLLFTFTSDFGKGSGLVGNLGSKLVFIIQPISRPVV